MDFDPSLGSPNECFQTTGVGVPTKHNSAASTLVLMMHVKAGSSRWLLTCSYFRVGARVFVVRVTRYTPK